MPGRKYYAGSGYRYGFNGQEKSDEIGEGFTTAEFWEYDSRIGRRWNLDPKPTIGRSEYETFFNNPIFFIDINGDTPEEGDPPGYVRGKNGDKLANRTSEGPISDFIESISPFQTYEHLYLAQALNFSKAIGGEFGYVNSKGFDRYTSSIKGVQTLGQGKAFVLIPKSTELYQQIIKTLKDVYKITEQGEIDAIAGSISGLKLNFEEGKDYSFLFWKSTAPEMYLNKVGPAVLPMPITTTIPIIAPNTGINTKNAALAIQSQALADEFALGISTRKETITDFLDLVKSLVNFAAEHLKNKRPSTKDKHTRTRSGNVYDKSQNSKRGAKNKKFKPRANPNKKK